MHEIWLKKKEKKRKKKKKCVKVKFGAARSIAKCITW